MYQIQIISQRVEKQFFLTDCGQGQGSSKKKTRFIQFEEFYLNFFSSMFHTLFHIYAT